MAAQSKKGKKARTIKRLVLQTVRTGIIKELNIKKGALGLLFAFSFSIALSYSV